MKSEQVLDLESQRVLFKDMHLRLKQQFQIEHQILPKLEQARSYNSKTNSTYQNIPISGKHRRLTVLGILITIPFLLVSVFSSDLNSSFVNDNDVMKSGYVIQNLKGDIINTFHSWNIPQERTLYIDLVNPNVIDNDKVQIIKDAILSEKTVLLDDSLFHKATISGSQSTYFLGWSGALKQASQTPTKFTIPTSFSINESSTTGDISIILSTLESPDGYSGFTRSTVENNQILKSTITIYKADQLSSAELETIIRHEFGHAVGLIHSSDPYDLMHPTIETNYPFISNCDISAITHLYDGNANDKAVCEI